MKFSQTVFRTWYNLDPTLWSIIPQRITFHADGSGDISSPFPIYTQDGQKSVVLRSKFMWSPARYDVYNAFEEMDEYALFDTIPRLIKSDEAWTRNTWARSSAPTYFRLDPDGPCSSETDSLIYPDAFIPASADGLPFPVELLEAIFVVALQDDATAQELTMVCKRSREIVMKRRRREAFAILTERFLHNGIALWIDGRHCDQVANSGTLPTLLYGMEARMQKDPLACGYSEPENPQGSREFGWNMKERMYHSLPMPLPEQESPTFWKRLNGNREYDGYPAIENLWA